MAKNWMEKVENKVNRDKEKSEKIYNNAVEIFKPIIDKYKVDGAIDLPIDKLTDKEKILVIKAWSILGYKRKHLENILGLKEFYRLKLNEIYKY